jgi:hypothetical protein
VRHNPSTVVVLASETSRELLDAVGRSMNVTLIAADSDGIDAAAAALRRASGISSPYVLVHGEPLAAMATAWQAMWDVTRGETTEFEVRAGEVLAAWRSGRFELPDYYLVVADKVVADPGTADGPPDFYLGPLRAARPNRVAVAVAAAPREQTAEVLRVLGSLPHGPWWPQLDRIIDSARAFYPGSLSAGMSDPPITLPA